MWRKCTLIEGRDNKMEKIMHSKKSTILMDDVIFFVIGI